MGGRSCDWGAEIVSQNSRPLADECGAWRDELYSPHMGQFYYFNHDEQTFWAWSFLLPVRRVSAGYAITEKNELVDPRPAVDWRTGQSNTYRSNWLRLSRESRRAVGRLPASQLYSPLRPRFSGGPELSASRRSRSQVGTEFDEIAFHRVGARVLLVVLDLV